MKIRFSLLALVVLFLAAASSALAQNLPSFTGRVNDFAQIYSSDFRQDLEQKLAQIETDTSNQIAVVTIRSLEGITIEEYAEELFQKWGIGQKNKDNGLLLLISKDDRKVRIEVGYGLESVITDGRAGEIIRNQIAPEFKKENYEQGTLSAINRINDYFNNNISDDSPDFQQQFLNTITENPKVVNRLSFLFIFIIVLLPYLIAYAARTKSIYGGAIVGLLMGFYLGFAISIVIALILALFFGIFGLFLDFILSSNYQKLKSLGKKTNFWSSRGGFWGGGRGGGGGGFGGFGGGSSGGGGASGSW